MGQRPIKRRYFKFHTNGERGYRGYYEGHMDKIKGEGGGGGGRWVWGGVEGWGENADNCN